VQQCCMLGSVRENSLLVAEYPIRARSRKRSISARIFLRPARDLSYSDACLISFDAKYLNFENCKSHFR
jgi:hypothetical protein